MQDILDIEDVYEPDEILRDVDVFDEVLYEDDLPELSFETTREAREGFSFLINEVESPEELFSLN